MLGSAATLEKEARQELARRELARRHLVDYMEYVSPYYHAARHHRLVAEYLEQVEIFIRTKGRTGIGRLLILEPPRHGKSEEASIHFPTWVLGKNPDSRIIIASYGADLATSFSKSGREIVLSDRFRAVFGELASVDSPVELAEDSRSVKKWDLATPHRGGVLAAGVGGGITGSGAHLFVVDDPFKNREEAESADRRESVWEWWTSTAYTRLEDGAAIVGMLTRWHGDDWAGRLLKAMATDAKADQYVVLCLPAIWEEAAIPVDEETGKPEKTFEEFHQDQLLEGVWVDEDDPLEREPGEALWPQKFDEQDMDRIRVNVGPYDFSALYQQTPYSREGTLFKRDWFTIIEAAPKVEELVARMWFFDTAGSKSGKGDYMAGGVLSLTRDDLVVVENVVRNMGTPYENDQEMIKALKADKATGRPIKAVWHQQGAADAGLSAAQARNRLLAKAGFTGRFDTVTGDKEERAGPWSSALQGNQVRLVRGAWNEVFIDEHIRFPKGHDDQVDFSSWGYSILTKGIKRKEARSYQG